MPRVQQNFSEIFWSTTYLGPGEPFSKSGMAEEEVGPKKYRKWISVKTVSTFLALNQLLVIKE